MRGDLDFKDLVLGVFVGALPICAAVFVFESQGNFNTRYHRCLDLGGSWQQGACTLPDRPRPENRQQADQ